MSKFTKKRIMDAFMSLLTQKSMDKLTVKDVIETAEVNRNTFYYYYEDIYDLMYQVFKTKFDDFCNETREQTTFYEEYIRAADFIMENRKMIVHIYHSKDRELIQTYLEKVTKLFVRYFVEKAAEPHALSKEGISYITDFYSDSIVGNTMHWVKEGLPSYREKQILLISKSFEGTIQDMIEVYQHME